MGKQPRNNRQKRQITPNLMSQKETPEVAETLVAMEEIARLVVNSQQIAEEINDQAQMIQQVMKILQGK